MEQEMEENTAGVAESVICTNCKNVVRPIDVPSGELNVGNGFHTCPVCKRSLEQEIDTLERLYGLKPGMETNLPDSDDKQE